MFVYCMFFFSELFYAIPNIHCYCVKKYIYMIFYGHFMLFKEYTIIELNIYISYFFLTSVYSTYTL